MNKERLITLTGIILAAAASRLLPHPYNFTPVAAIALFSGAQFDRKWLAFFVPLAALVLSDAVIGFYEFAQMLATYAGFAAVVCLGFLIRRHQNFFSIASATVAGAIAFFLITNCSLWINPSMYPKSFEGVMQGYVAGLPFFQNTLLSDIFYSALLFGGFALAERKYSVLKANIATA